MLKFLIVDGYPKKKREEFQAVGMKLAWELYAEMVQRNFPDAQCDHLLPADPDSKMPVGASLKDYSALLWTGCSLTVYEGDKPEVARQIQLCREIFDNGVPSFGSCWAIQISTVVAGGEVKAHPKGREMGIARKIMLTDEGRAHPMYHGKPLVFDAFISHDDEITRLPANSRSLATNYYTSIQACEINYKGTVFWGTQYHPEYNLHEMARLILAREQKLLKGKFFETSEEMHALVGDMESLAAQPERKHLRWRLGIGDDILSDNIRELEFVNWVKHQLLN